MRTIALQAAPGPGEIEQRYTAIIEKHGRWYVAWVEDVPGVNTQGRTLKEIGENVQEALQLMLEVRKGLESE